MGGRKKLQDRRLSITFSFMVGKMKYHATISCTEDGKWREVFLTTGKTGSEAHTLSRDLGIVISLLLQYGCPLSEVSAALTRQADGSSDGPLGILLDKITNKDSNND